MNSTHPQESADKFCTRKVIVWSIINGEMHPSLFKDDLTIEAFIPIVSALFPGINSYSASGFSMLMRMLLMPVLKKLFGELAGIPAESVGSEETVELPKILGSDGYEWQESSDWLTKFNDCLAAL